MEKIRVLFIHEKRVRKNFPVIVDVIENEVPDTYEIEDVDIKKNVIGKIEKFQPQIVIIMQSSKAVDVYGLILRIKEQFPQKIIFASLLDNIGEQQKKMQELKDAGVYKCYSSMILIDTLIHDMFVAMNME